MLVTICYPDFLNNFQVYLPHVQLLYLYAQKVKSKLQIAGKFENGYSSEYVLRRKTPKLGRI